MRRTLALTTVLSLTGCAQIFGLDTTSGTDASTGVSLTLERASIGASVVKSPLDVSMETATFLADDGADGYLRVLGAVSAPGVFTAVDLTSPTPVQFTLPDGKGEHIWATGATAQRGIYVAFEHPGADAPLASSAVTVMTTLPSPYVTGESFRVEIVGAWMQHGLAAAELPTVDTGATAIATGAIPYAMYTPIYGGPATRFTADDVLLFLRYSAGTLTGVLQKQLAQTDATDMIDGPMTAVSTTDSTLMATIDPPSLMTRYTAVRPAVGGAVAQSFFVRAAPGASLGQPQGTLLVSGSPLATATSIAAPFGNPFTSLGWTSVVEYATSMSRTYMIDMMHTLTLSATLSSYAEVTAAPLTFDSPAGLPITIQINATPLTGDGTQVMLDVTKPFVVDATLDRPTNTLYVATLVEVDASGATVTKKAIADMVVVDKPEFKFPAGLLVAGHMYFVRVGCYQGGFTAAASGDLQTVTLPYSIGTLDSGVFTVMP